MVFVHFSLLMSIRMTASVLSTASASLRLEKKSRRRGLEHFRINQLSQISRRRTSRRSARLTNLVGRKETFSTMHNTI